MDHVYARHRSTKIPGAVNNLVGLPYARRFCIALSEDGTSCNRFPPETSQKYCQPHHQEYKKLYSDYKSSENRYKQFKGSEGGFTPNEKREKVALGKKTLDLRNQVNRRFFSEHANNRGHVQWILKLEAEVKQLENTANSHGKGDKPLPIITAGNTREGAGKLVCQSLLSPEVSMSALDHLPEDDIIKLMKQGILFSTNEVIKNLYALVPSLDDSAETTGYSGNEIAKLDEGDHVIRFIFREYLLWKADVEILARARKMSSIDAFLRSSSPDELHSYIKFFENFGRVDTLHFLRDAVCDYILPPGTSTTTYLGGAVATEDKQRKMSVEGWDILYSYFSNVVKWWNVEQFCVRSEDLSLIKRLVALQRYGQSGGGDSSWLNIDDDVSQECLFAVLQGFCGISKGYADPPIVQTTEKDGILTEKHSRCYLAGRMAKNEPLASNLIQELVNRVGLYVVVVFDKDFQQVISQTVESEEDPWITRTRSVAIGGNLQDAPWKVDWSLKNVCYDLTYIDQERGRNMKRDFFEFIIIDRRPDKTFTILQDVAEALVELAGDPSPQQIIEQAIRYSIPTEEQDQFLENISWKKSFADPVHIPEIHYEGSRVRAWDVMENDPGLIRQAGKAKRSRSDLRITKKILAQMESSGVIKMLKAYQQPHTFPVLVHGTDGFEDLYFDYNLGRMDESALRRSPLMSPEIAFSGEALYEFANSFKAVHPDAVFSKGRLHVHYCAWPMPAIKHGPRGIPTFQTMDGHQYQWNCLAFDSPLSRRAWQYYVHCEINRKLPFTLFVLSTFVVCAESSKDAEANLTQLLATAAKHDWKLSVPEPHLWTADVDSLDLHTLWRGTYPLLHKQTDKPRASKSESAVRASTCSLQ